LIVGIPKETVAGERRVAVVANVVSKLTDAGAEVWVESGAGVASGCPDSAYEEAGARIQPDAAALYAGADVIARVQPPSPAECSQLREGGMLVCVLQPFAQLEVVKELAARRITSFSLDLMPRITRAQNMDILSAMSTVTGYLSILIAARHLPKFFPMLMTAAGTIKPARVLVLGAGVAGLQAIATARRLGAVVEAFDIRAAAKEQVESLGARFVELEGAEDAETAGGYAKEQTAEQLAEQRKLLSARMAAADAVICTALVPGRRAPVLMTEDQVKGMRPGSIVVDLAAEQGGNCEVTRAGQVVEVHGVSVHGPTNLASSMPVDASSMFSRVLTAYLTYLISDGKMELDFDDELVRDVVVTHEGDITHEAVRTAAEK
jgi:NAD(P) transhydrogenase subunit alpha